MSICSVLLPFWLLFCWFEGVTFASSCGTLEFPCGDGTCVPVEKWCDTSMDCNNALDEKYCRMATRRVSDPNDCGEHMFRCDDGPCIPLEGICDGYPSCEDHSDEDNCYHTIENVMDTSTSTNRQSEINTDDETTVFQMNRETTMSAFNGSAIHNKELNDASFVTEHSIPIHVQKPALLLHDLTGSFTQVSPRDFKHQRTSAQHWVLLMRDNSFGWGEDTARMLTALHLSDADITKSDSVLMEKELNLQLSLAMMRNGSKPISLSDLSLYINALLSVCNNPRNFYGTDLVDILRYRTDSAQYAGTFVSPSVYLTLCLCNATTYNDVKKIQEMVTSRAPAMDKSDILALAGLATSCLFKRPKYSDLPLRVAFLNKLIQKVENGFSSNIYETALLIQALNEARVNEMLWKRPQAMDLIKSLQDDKGSFGDLLATYYVLPVLSGKSLASIDPSCGNEQNGLTPLAVLKNTKREKVYINYSLYFGDPVEISETLQLKVAKGTNILDIMRLAEETNRNFRFKYDSANGMPVVYCIGGVANDAEKGLYWTLHIASRGATGNGTVHRIPYHGNISTRYPDSGEEMIFWLKPLK